MVTSHSPRAMALSLALSLAALPFAHAAPARAPRPPAAGGPKVPELDPDAKRSPALFQAIGMGNVEAVKGLLAHGTDANSVNTLGMSALQIAAATGNMEIIQTLLAAGANVNHQSIIGTPISFAAYQSQPEVMELLLQKGAKLEAGRPDAITTLMIAARAGNAPVLRMLLARKADVAAVDNHGSTALSHAAREGRGEAVDVLLQAGAKVDAADADGWTPLMHAAVNGHADVVQRLLKAGAKPNLKDKQGRTPLLLAANFGDHAEVVRALLQAGADKAAKDAQGRTARGLAEARGYAGAAAILQTAGAPKLAGAQRLRTPREAARKSLGKVEHAMQVFAQRTGCVSCHHEGIARFTTGFAQARGYAIDAAFDKSQEKRVVASFDEMLPLLQKAVADPRETGNVPIADVGDLAPGNGSLMLGLAEHKTPKCESISAAAMVVARTQTPDGDWRFGMQRVPVQSSFFSSTAMTVKALRTYAPAQYAGEVDERVAKAKQWLLTASVKDTEDRVFRLLGLKWAGATAAERQKALEELRATQRPDGGWAQYDGANSDAYATGSALFALNQGGDLPSTDPVYRRGLQFLLRTQQDDGTWYVYKRAMPANNYFDAEFPYGQSQYISHVAACWSTMALIIADDPAAAPRAAFH